MTSSQEAYALRMPLPQRIMVVTAHVSFNRFLLRFLRSSGYEPLGFLDFSSALPALMQEPPDLLISGWVFGVDTALVPLRYVAAAYPQLPILVCTGGGAREPIPWPSLRKPFIPADLQAALRKLL